ncbi:DUF3177 family protein [Gloeocapsopsis crepidinum LEGE 06123]|uniref:DUF3177 family protein n=1 Tax=Gloeocapsopsis crepidinum LEGE 06123 TaxID=588587 RepID=A0ABR9UQ01_9CHRO|nr:DUF3177 family protein [Gloeocapsopsis crepidinum]MBE9190123.1 DUF3177 family protein [Gloeocapsopsis crepidinum LEGE 06123]
MQNEVWLRPLVWMDYRLAVLFTVLVPLILLVWAFVQKAEAIQRLLTIYWRVSSLLAITVYLLIAAIPVGYISGTIARVLIPIALWFWIDLNEEIDDQPRGILKLTFNSWRWAMTIYSVLGAIASIPFLQCAFSREALATPLCTILREPPLLFREYFHANSTPQFLGFLGVVGLIFYVICLSYFVLFKLGKQGRSALPQ